MRTRTFVASIAATLLLATSAAVVVAAPSPAAVEGGSITRMSGSGLKAMLLHEDLSDGSSRLTWVIEDKPSGNVRFVGSTGTCDEPVTTADRTFRSDPLPYSWGTTHTGGFGYSQTVRLVKVGAGTLACGITLNFEKVNFTASASTPAGGTTPDGFIARFGARGMALLQSIDADSARLSVAVGDVNGDGTDLLLIASSATCAQSAPPSTRYYTYELKDVLISSVRSRRFSGEDLWPVRLRSVRINDVTNGGRWGCARPYYIEVVPILW